MSVTTFWASLWDQHGNGKGKENCHWSQLEEQQYWYIRTMYSLQYKYAKGSLNTIRSKCSKCSKSTTDETVDQHRV